MTETQVLIVGAGAAGSTLALLLARRGVRSIVLERRTTPLQHPAAHVVNARSLEIWNAASPDLAARIAALAPPPEDCSLIRWCGRLDEAPLGELDLLSEPEAVSRVRGSSPFLISHIGQHLLMPILWEVLDEEPLIDFRRGHDVSKVMTTPEGAAVQVTEPSGHSRQLRGRYVVAAEGANSRTRDAMGVAMVGPVLAAMGSVFFHAPDLHPAGTPRPLLTWIYQPSFCGVLIAHADGDYILMTAYLHPSQPIAADGRRYWERVLPRVLGADVVTTIRSTCIWTMTSQVAERFRDGPVFLIGDAAHRFPHTGGFGLNSGVQDAHNLAWKLAAVLGGRASESLLDTYEIERRPVVAMFARQSMDNHFLLDDVTRHIGVTNRMLFDATRVFGAPFLGRVPAAAVGRLTDALTSAQQRRTAVLGSGGRRGRRIRAAIATRIPAQAEHFVSSGLELGYAYGGPLICTEPGPQPVGLDEVMLYRPTTWPGARLPHAPLLYEGTARNAHDLLDPEGLTLFTADPDAWSASLRTGSSAGDRPYAPPRLVPLVPADGEGTAQLLNLYEVGADGAVLVRPDGHVLWRTADAADEATPQLRAVLDTVWGRFFHDVALVQHTSRDPHRAEHVLQSRPR